MCWVEYLETVFLLVCISVSIKIGEAHLFNGWWWGFKLTINGRYIHPDGCPCANQGTSFSSVTSNRVASNHNGLAVGAATAMKGEDKASRRKLTCIMKLAAVLLVPKRSGSVLLLGLNRRVRVSKEYLFCHGASDMVQQWSWGRKIVG